MLKSGNEYKNFLEEGYILGNYEIISLLGVGGFGITYKAKHKELGTLVAIKEYMPSTIAVRDRDDINITVTNIINADDYKFGLDKFLDEAKVLASFKHPNIVGINDFFRENGTAYFVMPFVEGETLGNFASNINYNFDENKMISLIVPILEGLRETHSKSILHRDIKLDNIFLSQKGMPILIDFGAARIDFAQKSLSINAILTPPYAPPEQYGSQRQGAWTDIYALGMVMYKLITKIPSKDIPSSIDRANAIYQNEEDPLLPMSNNTLSNNLQQVIMKALSIKVSDRFQSAEEMIDAIMENQSLSDSPATIQIEQREPMTEKITLNSTSVALDTPSNSKNKKIILGFLLALLLLTASAFCILSDNSPCKTTNEETTEESESIQKTISTTSSSIGKKKAFTEALELLKNNDQEEAKEYFLIAANQGHIKAKVYLGEIYHKNKDYKKAKIYYYEAAKAGDIDGQFWFSEMTRFDGNEAKSKVWYRKAAKQGHVKAKFILAEIHYMHDEYGDAQKLYEEVVNKHVINNNVIKHNTLTKEEVDTAKLNLTYIYFAIDKNSKKAKKIVPRDVPQGEFYLSQILYSEGNLKASKKWAKKAARNGNVDAKNFLKKNF